MQVPETDKSFLLTYPNLDNPDAEVLLENEHVVLQRLVVGPGEWEGIHSHPGNQLYVHIKGGEWSGRSGALQSSFKPIFHQPLYRDSVTARMKKTPAHPV